jgi:hypothetical protein
MQAGTINLHHHVRSICYDLLLKALILALQACSHPSAPSLINDFACLNSPTWVFSDESGLGGIVTFRVKPNLRINIKHVVFDLPLEKPFQNQKSGDQPGDHKTH